jgi:hypothetical protein
MDTESTEKLNNDSFEELLSDTLKSKPEEKEFNAARSKLEAGLFNRITPVPQRQFFLLRPVWKLFTLIVIVLSLVLILNFRNLSAIVSPQPATPVAEIDDTISSIDNELGSLQPDEQQLVDFNGDFTQIINQN